MGARDDFFETISDEDMIIFVPTGYNGVWLDQKSIMKAEITYGMEALMVRLEFLKA
jgi:hypothetical protein